MKSRVLAGKNESEGLERGVGEPHERAPLAEAGGERPDHVRDDPKDPHPAETSHLQD